MAMIMQSLRFGKDLFIDTFKKGGAHREEMEKVKHSLYTRAWITHSVMMFTRVLYPLLGIALW